MTDNVMVKRKRKAIVHNKQHRQLKTKQLEIQLKTGKL